MHARLSTSLEYNDFDKQKRFQKTFLTFSNKYWTLFYKSLKVYPLLTKRGSRIHVRLSTFIKYNDLAMLYYTDQKGLGELFSLSKTLWQHSRISESIYFTLLSYNLQHLSLYTSESLFKPKRAKFSAQWHCGRQDSIFFYSTVDAPSGCQRE